MSDELSPVIVIAPHSPGFAPTYYALVSEFPEMNISPDDPRLAPPPFPTMAKMKGALCFAKAHILNDPNYRFQELVGLLYVDRNGDVFPTAFFSNAPNTTPFDDLRQWLIDNNISSANVVGEVHNHPSIDAPTDLANRFPSNEVILGTGQGDWANASYLIASTDFTIAIVGPTTDLRTFSYSDKAFYNSLTYDQLRDAPEPGIVTCP